MQTVRFVDLGSQYKRLRNEILFKFDTISAQGAYVLSQEVSEFEKKFAEFCGVKYSVGVGSGSDALFMPLAAKGIGVGDEVITAPNSFIASAWVIARTGAKIVFSDVGEDMNLDPNLLEDAITERTKAIMPVHLTGRIADMESILAIAEEHKLMIIEDAAQAVGASYKNRRAGSFGLCAGFSLHPLKNLHVHGDGGIITTNDEVLYEALLKYRNHGLANRDVCEFWGINSRLDAIQAAIANLKLNHLDTWNSRFREIACMYSEHLEDYVSVPRDSANEKPVYHRFMIRHHERDKMQEYLASKGIETKVNYPIPLHLQPAAQSLGYERGDFPMAEKLADCILSLPIYPELRDEQVLYVIENVIDYINRS